MNTKHLVATISALCSLSAFALSDVGLTHRWSFNGDLMDSFGDSALYPRDTFTLLDQGSEGGTWNVDGDAFSTDGEVFNFKGGVVQAESTWETPGITGPEICDTSTEALTIELWAAQCSWQADSSIFQLGKTSGIGMFWDSSSGTETSTNGLIKIDGSRIWVSLSERILEHKTTIGAYALGVQYHIAMVIAKQSDGSWKFVCYRQDPKTGVTLAKEEHTKDSSWSFANMETVSLSLGFGDFDKDNGYAEIKGAHAIYDEVRVWNRALSEEELSDSAKEGPNTKRFGKIPDMQSSDVYATNITSHFRQNTNGLVDVEFDVVGQSENPECILLQAEDQSTHSIYTAKSVSGDWSFAQGHHKVLWDIAADGINLSGEDVHFIVSSPLYCVIDLAEGRNATSYPVKYLAQKPTTWTDDFKTTKIVFRWCGNGVENVGSFSANHNYYAGVFELSRGQYNKIYNESPFAINAGDATLPAIVHSPFAIISGGADLSEFGWAISGSIVDLLRRKTGLGGIGVPKDVTWQHTCLAGASEIPYFFGSDTSLLGEYAWYYANAGSAMHSVGEKACNKWGLYDTHGNSSEMVISTNNDAKITTFMLYGGSRAYLENGCKATSRCTWTSDYEDWYGVRLFMSAPWEASVVGVYIPEAITSSITYSNLRGATHENSATYQEGNTLEFSAPIGTVIGYTFAGWTPSGITVETTGDVSVSANWTANSYSVVFHANEGLGTMSNQSFTYDVAQPLSPNVFSRSGYTFTGWATSSDGVVTYADMAIVSNLTAAANGTVDLYAVWNEVGGDTPGGGDDPTSYDPPNWVGVTKSDTMAVYGVIRDKKTAKNIEAAGSLLAAFDSTGECRGVSEIEEGPLGMLFQLSVGINSTSEAGFTLKVWDASTGEITEICETIDANSDKQIGEIFDPVVFEIGALSQVLTLGEGWSWVSFCLTPEDAKIGTLFSGLAFANGDVLKASDKIVTYYNGVWYPATYSLKPGAAYMIRKTSGGNESVLLEGTQMADGLTLSAGWNWFGSTSMETQTIAAVTYSGGFANSDQVKSSAKFATYYSGKWYSSDFKLCPGVGYVAKLANAGTLYFGAAPALASTPLMAMPKLVLASANSNQPSWSPVIKGDSMAVYATIHDLSTDTDVVAVGSILAAFDSNGECRGMTVIEDGPLGKIFQLPIGLESTSETGFVLKIWDAANDVVYDVIETVDANTDKQVGEIFEPTIYTIKSVPDPLPEIVNPTPEQIENVLEKAEDPKLAANITNETDYADFRTWAGMVKPHGGNSAAGVETVMSDPNAWLSYALGSETLIETAPTNGQMRVEKFEPTSSVGAFNFTVSIDDIAVGSDATKDNLKKVFGLEGGVTLDSLSSTNINITFESPENGKVKFTAGPKNTTEGTFFMKVKMTP